MVDKRASVHPVTPVPGSRERLDSRLDRYLREDSERASERGEVAAAAQSAMAGYLANLAPWSFYATMTYDPARVAGSDVTAGKIGKPPSIHACQRHVNAYVRNVKRELATGFGAAVGLEYTKAEWPHYHALLTAGSMSQRVLEVCWRNWFNFHGFIKLSRIPAGDQLQIAKYCSKYLTKEDGELFLLGDLGAAAIVPQLELGNLYNKARKSRS